MSQFLLNNQNKSTDGARRNEHSPRQNVLHSPHLLNHAFQLHHHQCGRNRRGGQARLTNEIVNVARIVTDQLQKGALFGVFW
jgi:hypothetical protein